MRVLFRIVLFLFMLITLASKKNSVSHQRKDLLIFKKVLLAKEGRIDLHASVDSINYYFNELSHQFEKELSILDQYKLYSLTIAKINCGHTQIHPNKEVLREWLSTRNSLPIDYYLVEGRLIVNKLLPEDLVQWKNSKYDYNQIKRIKPNSEILEIDGKTVNDILEGISKYLSSDENAMDFKLFQASHMFDFYRHLESPFKKDSIEVKFTIEGDTSSLFLKSCTAPVYTMNQRLRSASEIFKANEVQLGEFQILNQTGYFRFKSFKSSFGKSYEDFLEESFRKLKSNKIDKLIIDLRGNTGGAMQYSLIRYFVGEGVYLGKYIIEKPKQTFENKHLKKLNSDYIKHRRASQAQKRLQRKDQFNDGEIYSKKVDPDLMYNGQVVVITDEGTFSSASILACHLKTLCKATIIGRKAGGSFYSGNAGSLVLQLPNSRLTLFVNPNTFYSNLPPSDNTFEIKEPDKIVISNIVDRAERDSFYMNVAFHSF